MSSTVAEKYLKFYFLNQRITWRITTNIRGIENISTRDENCFFGESKQTQPRVKRLNDF